MKSYFPKYADMPSFYGNPDINGDGMPDKEWEVKNLMAIVPPYPMYWSWSKQPVKLIRFHNKCGYYFLAALREIAATFDPEQIKKLQLDQCGGGYNFRTKRDSDKLSVHSYGAAIDLAPEANWLGRKWSPSLGMMPRKAVDIFKAQGLRWGGDWTRQDCMHFEASSK